MKVALKYDSQLTGSSIFLYEYIRGLANMLPSNKESQQRLHRSGRQFTGGNPALELDSAAQ